MAEQSVTAPQVVSVRLDPDVLAQLRDIANQRGWTLSDVLRRGAIGAANEPNEMRIEWTTPPTQVSADGLTATFTAPNPEPEPVPVRRVLIRYDIPLRRDMMVWLVLPDDLTTADADRLCGILQTLPLDAES